MKKIVSVVTTLCLCVCLTGCNEKADVKGGQAVVVSGDSVHVITAEEATRAAEKIVKKMSLQDRISQLFMVDLNYFSEDGKPVTKLTDKMLKKIRESKIAGIYVNADNIIDAEQIEKLTKQLSTCTEIPLYIATSEEGGGENSIAEKHDDIQNTGYLAPNKMGSSMTPDQVESAGKVLAQELLSLGFNLNFAPVADVQYVGSLASYADMKAAIEGILGPEPLYVKPEVKGKKNKKAKKRLIKKAKKEYESSLKKYNEAKDELLAKYTIKTYPQSCFSNKEEVVSDDVAAMIKGIRQEGVGTVTRVFPNISSVVQDHLMTETRIDTGVGKLRRECLQPYKEAVEAGTDMVQVGHVVMSKVDPDYLASMSSTIITDLLRDEMGYDGVVITEDMSAPVITNQFDQKTAIIKAIYAGADLMYNPQDLDGSKFDLQQAVAFGNMNKKIINQAAIRIIQNKILRGIYTPPIK